MVEPILHFVIPIVMLLAFKPNIDKKLVFGLSILTIAPDLDFIVGHRVLHNIFFVVFLSVLVYLLFKFLINYNRLKKENENKDAFYLSLYYLFFHMFLDMSRPGIPFLYPLSDRLSGIDFNLITRSFGNGGMASLETQANVLNQSIVEATKAQDIWIITTLGIILLVVFIVLMVSYIINKRR